MALAEGLRRIRLIGKGILWTGFVIIAIAVGVLLELMGTHYSSLSPIFMICGAIGINLWILGFIISLVMWIVEGFLLAPQASPNP